MYVSHRTGIAGAVRTFDADLDAVAIVVPKPIEDARRRWHAVREAEPIVEPTATRVEYDIAQKWVAAAPTRGTTIKHPPDWGPLLEAEIADAAAERAHHGWALALEVAVERFYRAAEDNDDALADACQARHRVLVKEFRDCALAIPERFAGGDQLAFAEPTLRDNYSRAASLWREWEALRKLLPAARRSQANGRSPNPLAQHLSLVRTDVVYEDRRLQADLLRSGANLAAGLDLARRVKAAEDMWLPRGFEASDLADKVFRAPGQQLPTGPLSAGTWIAG